jgi:predicted RNase H-like HicB family nuclease
VPPTVSTVAFSRPRRALPFKRKGLVSPAQLEGSFNQAAVLPRRSSLSVMSDPLRLTIVYEPGEDGWVVASVPEVPGALSQGETREEARANVIDALRGILELRFGEHALSDPAQDSEQLELVIAA